MSSLFKIKFPKSVSGNQASATSSNKKDPSQPQLSALEKLLQDAGPIQDDGNDKFFGLENFGNTCYANSIIQCLYYSVPFREQVMSYPKRTPTETVITGSDGQPRLKIRPPVSIESLSPTRPKPGAPNAARPGVGGPGQKPEDKDSQEYKKKQLLAKGPVYNMDYDNAANYEMPESLFTSLKDLFEAVAASQERMGIISPQKFIEVLKRDNEMFRGNIHQDAHEFLNMLLNQVVDTVEDYTKQMKAIPSAIGMTQDDSLNVAFENVASHAGAVKAAGDIRWVHELFQGTLTSETKCLTCENVSQRDEPFLDLSVDLEAHSSVTSCLRKFSEEEMLRERDKFFCDNCGGLQEAEKRMKVKRSPKILALHLKRFRYTEDLQRLQKLFHRVVYPYHLRLFNTTADADDPDRIYELYAVVVHIGIGPYHGHYVSIIKTPDRGWLLFDDELVEPVDKAFVLNFFGDRANLACAYVLFYRETTLEAVKQEQEAEGRAAAAKYAASAAPPKESHGFGLGLTLKTNGIAHAHAPVASATSPDDDAEPLVSLDHAITAPPMSATPISPSHTPAIPSTFTTPLVQSHTTTSHPATDLGNSPLSPKAGTPLSKKEEKVRKHEEREKEKERKAAEKEAAKQAKVAKKEEEARQKQAMKNQTAEIRAAMDKKSTPTPMDATSTAKTEGPFSQKESHTDTPNGTSTTVSTNTASASTATPTTAISIQDPTSPSHTNGHAHTHSSSFGSGAFNRFRQSSKSLKAKPKFWSGSGSSSTTPASKDDSAIIEDADEKDGREKAEKAKEGEVSIKEKGMEETKADKTDKPDGKETQKRSSRFSLRRKGSLMWNS